MKTVLRSALLFATISMTSCVELPDLNPQTNENVVVTAVFETYEFDMENSFFEHIDINGNGTSDFYFYGQQYEDAIMGALETVIIDGAYEYNTVIKGSNITVDACGVPLEFVPIKPLQSNFNVGWGAEWGEYAALYMRSTPENGCTVYRNYVSRGNDFYFGLKFTDEGQTYYGWIRIGTDDITTEGLPFCAERWIVKQYAYNSVPDTGLRIPD